MENIKKKLKGKTFYKREKGYFSKREKEIKENQFKIINIEKSIRKKYYLCVKVKILNRKEKPKWKFSFQN